LIYKKNSLLTTPSLFMFIILFLLIFLTFQGYFAKIYAQPENSDNRNMIHIGGLIYSSDNGNITNIKTLDKTGPLVKELSFIEKGKINDTINVTYQGTYINTYISNNTIRGEGNGILTTEDADEIATWQAYDSGIIESDDSQIYYGIVFFNSTSGILSFLDNKVGLYIIEIEKDNGYYSRHIWDWK
jgi:hypothetical protein